MPQVIERTGLGRTMIYQLESQGCFPARFKLSKRAVGWRESEVDAWLKARVAARIAKVPITAAIPPSAA